MLRTPRLLIAGRALSGFTQAQLAELAEIALSVLQAIEQGKANPKNTTLISLIDTLKKEGVVLLPETDEIAWGLYVTRNSPAHKGGLLMPQPSVTRGRPKGSKTVKRSGKVQEKSQPEPPKRKKPLRRPK